MDFTNNPVLTFAQACEYTGYSKSYMYKLTSENIVPFSKPNGKSIFFDRSKLEQWMLGNPNMTRADLRVRANEYVNSNPSKA